MRRFREAWARVDIEALVALLADDALLTMPPEAARFEGSRRDRRVLRHRSDGREPRPDQARTREGQRPAGARRLRRRRAGSGPRCIRRDGLRDRRRPDQWNHRVPPATGSVHETRSADRARPRNPGLRGEAWHYDEKLADRVRDILEGDPDVSERKMFGGLAFMVDGHMACGIVGDDLMLRLGAEGAEAALQEAARPADGLHRPADEGNGVRRTARPSRRGARSLGDGRHHLRAHPAAEAVATRAAAAGGSALLRMRA